jgi:hypothetical protein
MSTRREEEEEEEEEEEDEEEEEEEEGTREKKPTLTVQQTCFHQTMDEPKSDMRPIQCRRNRMPHDFQVGPTYLDESSECPC